MKLSAIWMSILAAGLAVPLATQAATLAEDDAADPTYETNFDPGQNGGTGFGPWEFTQGANSGRFVGDSNLNGFGDVNDTVDINTTNSLDLGVAWGLFASSGELAEAIRPLSVPLKPGDTFEFSIDNGFVNAGGSVGVALENSDGEPLFEYFFAGGASAYQRQDAAGFTDSLIGFTTDGIDFTFTLDTATTYSGFTQIVGGISESFGGTLMTPATGTATIDRIRFFNFDAGSGTTNDFLFNKLLIDGTPSASVGAWSEYQ